MDVVLGVSLTPTAARLVMVEGIGADGKIVDTEMIDVADGSDTTSDQVLAAIIGTQHGIVDSGHRLASTGVVWSDHAEAATLRDALADRGVGGVEFFSPLHAGGALAKAASNVTGYEKAALLVVESDAATVAVVNVADGSVVGLANQSIAGGVTVDGLAGLINPLKGQENAPDGVFLLGLGTDVSALAASLGKATSLPVSSPEQSELALARGAALAAAKEPGFEADTALLGQAYSLDGLADAGYPREEAQAAGEFGENDTYEFEELDQHPPRRNPFPLVGAPLMLVFAICVVALAVSLSLNVRQAGDQSPVTPDGAVVDNPLPPAMPRQAVPPVPPVQAPEAAHSVVAPPPLLKEPEQVSPPLREGVARIPAELAPARLPAAVLPLPVPLLPPFWGPRRENHWWRDRFSDEGGNGRWGSGGSRGNGPHGGQNRDPYGGPGGFRGGPNS